MFITLSSLWIAGNRVRLRNSWYGNYMTRILSYFIWYFIPSHLQPATSYVQPHATLLCAQYIMLRHSILEDSAAHQGLKWNQYKLNCVGCVYYRPHRIGWETNYAKENNAKNIKNEIIRLYVYTKRTGDNRQTKLFINLTINRKSGKESLKE
jgi:hypothetical protein